MIDGAQQISRISHEELGELEKVVITSPSGDKAVIERHGAWVKSLQIDGTDVFFPRTTISVGGEEKQRGGMHICFPQGGPDSIGLDGARLPQHGFARDSDNWEFERVFGTEDRGLHAVLLTLSSDDMKSYPSYPYNYMVEILYMFAASTFVAKARVTNQGDSPMPVGFAFHPYYLVPEDVIVSVPNEFVTSLNSQKRELGKPLVQPIGTYSGIGHTGLSIGNRVIQITTAGFPLQVLWSDDPHFNRFSLPTVKVNGGMNGQTANHYLCLEPFPNYEDFRTDNGVWIPPQHGNSHYWADYYMRIELSPKTPISSLSN